MDRQTDILRLRVLLYFLVQKQEDCTVTQIARALNEEKYTISRIMTMLEKELLLNRENVRRPILTAAGEVEARTYAERTEVIMNHLMYEGIDADSARKDALYWALYSSESSIQMFRESEARYHAKYELRNRKRFSGEILCKYMKDGIYRFPFLIYRECIQDGSNLSIANAAFENPCILVVKDGVGTIQLRTQTLVLPAKNGKQEERGRVKVVKYFDSGDYFNAEFYGNVISFPAAVLNFINLGVDIGQVLQGSVCLKIGRPSGDSIKEYLTIFTIFI